MMPFVFVAQAVEQVTKLTWLKAPPGWVTFLIVLAILAFSFGLYLLERRKSPLWVRMLCALLLSLFLGSVLVLLYDPVEETYNIETRPSTVVLALDTSTSMSDPDRYPPELLEDLAAFFGLSDLEDKSRLGLAKDMLLGRTAKGFDLSRYVGTSPEALAAARERMQRSPLGNLLEKNNVVVYGFDATRVERARAEVEDSLDVALAAGVTLLRAEGDATRIGDCLNQILNDLRSERIAAIVLVSDGQQNSGLILPEQVAERMQRKGIPLFAIGVGNPLPAKDIWIEDLDCPRMVVRDNMVKLDVKVVHQGYDEGKPIRLDVILRSDSGQEIPVASEELLLGPEGQAIGREIRFRADKEGTFEVVAQIIPDSEEIDKKNNVKDGDMKVRDRKIRVLYVDGLPRWEYRYLKNALIRDSSLEAQCFLWSADPSFPQESSPGLESLVGYPKTHEELGKYDVIVFGDFMPEYLTREQMEITKEFVIARAVGEEDDEGLSLPGGGILFIAGEQAMPDRWAGTPIADLFPFTMDRREEDSLTRGPLTQSFPLQLTLLGRQHVLSKLSENEEINEHLWNTGGGGLPGQLWHYPIMQPKPQAEVLVAHPFEKTSDGKPRPLVLTSYVGKGTVMFQAVDELWRWRARNVAYFEKYYQQTIQWLASTRLQQSDRYKLTTDKSQYALRERVTVVATVRDAKNQPSTADDQKVRVFSEDGYEDLLLTKVPERPGDFEITYIPPKTGDYRVAILTDGADGRAEELAETAFDVVIPRRESLDRRLDKETLASMCRITGGEYFDLGRWPALFLTDAIGSTPEKHKDKPVQVKLWDNWYVLAVLLAFVSIEWILRKAIKLV